MSVNKNNFLRWTGAESPASFTITPTSHVVTFYNNVDSISFNPLAGAAASNGINTYSVNIIDILDGLSFDPIDLVRPCFYNGVDTLTVYRPVTPPGTGAFFIKYNFQDVVGNLSGDCYAQIIMSPIFTSWTEYPPSSYCTLDGSGNNTGFLAWGQLQLINTGTGLPVSPLTLKDNVPSDSDYIAPTTDYVTCPVIGTGEYAPLIVGNFSQNGADTNPNDTITITQVTVSCAACGVAGSAVVINLPCSIAPGQTQRFNVPAGVTWTFTLLYTVTGGGNMDTANPQRYWYSQASGVVSNYPGPGTNPVINAGIMGSNPLLVPYPAGLTIFVK